MACRTPTSTGKAEIKATKRAARHIIDCNAAPFIPDGWRIEPKDQLAGAVGRKLLWGKNKVGLFLAKKQKKRLIDGHELRKELKNKPVLKANVLDYLRAHPGLIPEEWKNKAVFFWGTVYCDPGGSLCVRCLCWDGDGGHWFCDWCWLGDVWDADGPAAVSAS